MRPAATSIATGSVFLFCLVGCGSTVETPPSQNGPDSGLGADAGGGDVATQPDTDFGPNVGEKDLPCSAPGSTLTKLVFHANDGTSASGPYQVPIATDNPYTCWVFDSGDKDLHVTDWAPLLDNTTVVHHIVMFGPQVQPGGGPEFGGATGPVDCKAHMPLNLFEFGWAPGGKNYSFPSDVEQVIPAHTKLVMQVHYNTGAALGVAQTDTSGIALCSTSEDRPKQAGVLLVGSMEVTIPPHTTGTEIVGTCPPPSWKTAVGISSIPGDFEVLGAFPHMHTHGTKIYTNQIRGGSTIDKLGDQEDWSFNNQGFSSFPTAKSVKTGDVLETHCVYDNATDNTISWGENTEDEMCFNFLYTVPDLTKAWGNPRANLCFPSPFF